SDLTFGTTAAGVAATLVVAVVAVAGCQTGTADTRCTTGRQGVLPRATPLPLWPEGRIDRLEGGFVLLRADTSPGRWTATATLGAAAPEQAVALPAGTLRAFYALAGVGAPGDTVVVGALVPAANGTDAELRFIAAPIDGSAAGPAGAAVVTFPGGADP